MAKPVRGHLTRRRFIAAAAAAAGLLALVPTRTPAAKRADAQVESAFVFDGTGLSFPCYFESNAALEDMQKGRSRRVFLPIATR